MGLIDGVTVTPLKVIESPSGNVYHALKEHEASFFGFGEAYFSSILYNHVKGWKKHRQMILNVVVPVGAIRFVMFDAREDSSTNKLVQEVELSPGNYQRLTVPPGVWMAFKGMSKGINLLLNIASIRHDPAESENLPLENDIIPYKGFIP